MARDYGSYSARTQTARSAIAGKKPDFLKAGALAYNYTDKRLYIGDFSDTPSPFFTRIEDFDAAKGYLIGDIVVYQSDLWSANAEKSPGSAFNATDWDRLTDSGRASASEPFATTWLSGGAVTVTGVDTIQVAAGSGVVVDNTDPSDVVFTVVSWPDFNATLPPAASGWSYIAIDATASLVTADYSSFNTSVRRTQILIGGVKWDGSTIDALFDLTVPSAGTAENFADFVFGSGGSFRAQGVDISAASGLQIDISSGRVFALGWNSRTEPGKPNLFPTQAQTPAVFDIVTQTTTVTAGTSDLTPGVYDVGGTSTAVPGGNATIQYIFAAPDLSRIYVQLGQTLYASVSAAANNIGDDFAALANPGRPPMIMLGAICIDGSATDLTSAIIILAMRRGLEPFSNIQGFDDSNYLLADGSRPMTGDLDLGGNSLTNGEIDGGSFAARDMLIRARHEGATGVEPTPATAAEWGEIYASSVDRKIWVTGNAGDQRLMAQYIRDHQGFQAYKVGDICIESDTLYRANVDNGPGAFNPADWDALSAASVNAVVVDPSSPGRNTVTPQAGDTEGLVVIPNGSQTADLMDIGGATVNPLGFANYRFGPANFRWAQSGHPFSAVGQAVTWAGGGSYGLSDPSSGDKSYGVIEEIIDANTVVIRTAGRLEGLDPAAFAGGSISNGTIYYASTTVPGQLTSVQPATGKIDPVLMTDTNSSGIVVIDAGITDAGDRVAKAGDTMTGDLLMSNARIELTAATPQIRFTESDQGTDQKTWRQRISGSSLSLTPMDDAGVVQTGGFFMTRNDTGAGDATFVFRDASLTSDAPSDDSVMTRARSDTRYVNNTGDTITGDLTVTGVVTNAPADSVNGGFRIENTFGEQVNLGFDGGGDNADFGISYLNNGGFDITLAAAGGIGLRKPTALSGLFTITNVTNQQILFDRMGDGSVVSGISVFSTGDIVFIHKTSGDQAAKVEPAGTTVSSTNTVITAEKGDARYVSDSTNLPVLGFARVNSGGSIARSGGIVSSVDHPATGVYTVNYSSTRSNAATFITPILSSNRVSPIITSQNNSSITIKMETGGGSAVDCAFNFMVM